jgi:hypothetical protein
MVISQVINAPLRTPAAPAGIVSFEWAHSATNAKTIVASLDTCLQLFAALGLCFDNLSMPPYAFASPRLA